MHLYLSYVFSSLRKKHNWIVYFAIFMLQSQKMKKKEYFLITSGKLKSPLASKLVGVSKTGRNI